MKYTRHRDILTFLFTLYPRIPAAKGETGDEELDCNSSIKIYQLPSSLRGRVSRFLRRLFFLPVMVYLSRMVRRPKSYRSLFTQDNDVIVEFMIRTKKDRFSEIGVEFCCTVCAVSRRRTLILMLLFSSLRWTLD